MSRTVFCRKYQKEMPGLERLPFPGSKGQDLYENVSAEAWQEWLQLQTMLINEKQLATSDAEARQWLAEQRELFLAGGGHAIPEGYTPPEA